MGIFSHRNSFLVRRGCTEKHRFATRKRAREALRYCKQQGRPQRAIYYCDFCHGYHLTSQERHAQDGQ